MSNSAIFAWMYAPLEHRELYRISPSIFGMKSGYKQFADIEDEATYSGMGRPAQHAKGCITLSNGVSAPTVQSSVPCVETFASRMHETFTESNPCMLDIYEPISTTGKLACFLLEMQKTLGISSRKTW